MNLSIGVLLAPYRVDFYNYLSQVLGFELYFQTRTFPGQLYSIETVENMCHFKPRYLRSCWLRNRIWSKGLLQLIRKHQPQYILVPEFSIVTFQLIFIKIFLGYNYQLISLCDDSYAMVKEGGFSKIHGFVRKICLPYLKDIIVIDKKATIWYQKQYNKGIWLPLIQDEKRMLACVKDIEKISLAYLKKWELQGIKTILFVGRFIETKNLPVLFQACSQLEIPYKIIVVGDGECKDKWESICKEMNIPTVFTGQKNGLELYAWYYTADIFVLPSVLEPFGAVTNEALLYGCNCCISENAGSACLIKEGVNGYTFNPHNSDDLYQKLLLALKMPRQHKSKMAYTFLDVMDNAFKCAMS